MFLFKSHEDKHKKLLRFFRESFIIAGDSIVVSFHFFAVQNQKSYTVNKFKRAW